MRPAPSETRAEWPTSHLRGGQHHQWLDAARQLILDPSYPTAPDEWIFQVPAGSPKNKRRRLSTQVVNVDPLVG